MVALGVGVQKALSRAKVIKGLWIASINSPGTVTIAGEEALIDVMVTRRQAPHLVRVPHASHGAPRGHLQ